MKNLKFNIEYKKSDQEKIKKCQSLRNFFEQKYAEKISGNQVTVWKEEPMVKTFRKNNLNICCFLIILGGKLVYNDFELFVNKIEEESGKIAKKTFLIKLLSKIRDDLDNTLLHHAAREGKVKCLKLLIGCKLNVNERKTDEEQISCLFMCKNGETKCANTLFRSSISVNVYHFQGKTPLHLAAHNGHQECLELLIRQGADVNAKDEDDMTPLHFAAFYGRADCLEVLLANGADVNARGIRQNTPLHTIGYSPIGSKAEKDRCVEMLIKAGADVNAKDADDYSPLHIAALNGKVNCLEVLLANGADVNARNNEQKTPLHLIGYFPEVSKEEKERCAEMLINAGADIDAEDEDGDTIFYHSFFQTLREERPDLFTQN